MGQKGGKNVKFVPYGIEPPALLPWNEEKLKTMAGFEGILDNNYYLIVARLEPENNIHMMIEGYLKSHTDKKLIIIGNFLSDKYRKRMLGLIKDHVGNHQVIFAGFIYDREILDMLRQHCFVYFHGHSVAARTPRYLRRWL